jgi:glycosyltransferase involved in cell wall biosynthesis
MPRATVVIPTLDRKEFLEQAIETVQVQTYEPLECIVVDDGSTDGTRDYLDSLDYDALRTIYRNETGLSSARNAAIDASDGEYVTFLDSDDILYPHTVETLVTELDKQPEDCAGAFGSKKIITPRGRVKKKQVPTGRMTEATIESAGAIGGPSSTTFRLEAVEDVGGFDESFDRLEDLDLYLTLLENYWLFGVDKVCCERRTHDRQISRDGEMMSRSYKKVLEKHGIEDNRRGRRK